MLKAYRFLAYAVSVEVVIQAMAMATAVAGLNHWIDGGATVTKKVVDGHPSFTGSFGFPVHAINGEMLIPLIVLALLVVSFFARVPGGTRLALYVVGLVAIQVLLGITQGDVPLLGLLHGANAFAILVVSIIAGRRATVRAPQATEARHEA